MPFFGFDSTFLLMLPALAFAFWAQWKVKSTYGKFAQVPAANGLTGRDMARAIMQRNGVDGVNVEQVGGTLSDHYDPRDRTVRLSSDIYGGNSIAAIAVRVSAPVEAEKVFDLLMGDQVEPRRQFIQTYARHAKNIDI